MGLKSFLVAALAAAAVARAQPQDAAADAGALGVTSSAARLESGATPELSASRYFVVVGSPALMTPAVRELITELDEMLEYVAARLETSPVELLTSNVRVVGGRTPDGVAWSAQQRDRVEARPLRLDLRAPTTACPVRGTANWLGTPSIWIYPTERTTIEQLRGVSAHELAHLFSYALFDGETGALVTEGFATWAAGRYWTDWQETPSLTAVVRGYREAGTYVPLSETIDLQGTINPGSELGEACLARRDMFYMEWGAFVEYLVAQHGLPAVHELVRRKLQIGRPVGLNGAVPSSNPRSMGADVSSPAGAFDYVGLFGRSLEQLEQEWLAAIDEAAP